MANGAQGQKTCFVVMGFGKKTDFQSNPQRVLDLDRTYQDIIEPAVTACKLNCIRGDTIIHSTVIDKPMYEHLSNADVVIADLSTSNANAIYELGVRHALRPHATIVIAEQNFTFPFDLNHVSILRYRHLEEEIGYREVTRMQAALQAKIQAALAAPQTDSPVFLFLPKLLGGPAPPAPAPSEAPRVDKSFADLSADLKANLHVAKNEVKRPDDWRIVLDILDQLIKLQPNDPYIIQQVALATYKCAQPDTLIALERAQSILEALSPETSSDVETVGLWGAIHKRLWEVREQPDDLEKAIRAYARGYLINDDYYNGINFAFLLNVRAARSQGDEAIADRVFARRVRREVLLLCEKALERGKAKGDDLYWIRATKAEALLGLGLKADADQLKEQILKSAPSTSDFAVNDAHADSFVPPADWMIDTLESQLSALESLKP